MWPIFINYLLRQCIRKKEIYLVYVIHTCNDIGFMNKFKLLISLQYALWRQLFNHGRCSSQQSRDFMTSDKVYDKVKDSLRYIWFIIFQKAMFKFLVFFHYWYHKNIYIKKLFSFCIYKVDFQKWSILGFFFTTWLISDIIMLQVYDVYYTSFYLRRTSKQTYLHFVERIFSISEFFPWTNCTCIG